MRKPYRFITTAMLLCCVAFATAATPAKDVFPMPQGVHTYSLSIGKVTLVAGSYQDTTSFRRTYNFFFTPKDDTSFNQVPLVRGQDDLEFTIASAGSGDDTIADGLVVQQGGKLFFVHAAKGGKKAGKNAGDVTATWFQFAEAPDSEPDGPAYALKPTFTRTYPAASKLNVDAVLRKESTLKPAR